MTIQMIILLTKFNDLYDKLIDYAKTNDLLNIDLHTLNDTEIQLLEILDEYDYIVEN